MEHGVRLCDHHIFIYIYRGYIYISFKDVLLLHFLLCDCVMSVQCVRLQLCKKAVNVDLTIYMSISFNNTKIIRHSFTIKQATGTLVVRWCFIDFSSKIVVVFFTLQMWRSGLLLLASHSRWLYDGCFVSNLSSHTE